jgi:carbonyl reductase 1
MHRPWWSKDTVAVVTGANKGIGYEIVRGLAKEGLTVVLTARDQSRGQAAVDALKAEGLESVWFHQLDIGSPQSAQVLASWLKSKFGGIDILVNNAAINTGPNGARIEYENAEAIIGTNYYGLTNVTEAVLPLLRPSPAGARIVNVSSRLGLYERLRSETLKKTFRDEERYTKDLMDSLAAKYIEDVKTGRFDEEGWIPDSILAAPMYSESKMFLSGYAVALANSLSKSQPEDHQILVTTFCPGVTQTDMLQGVVKEGYEIPEVLSLKTVADGADTGVWLSLLPKEDLAEKNGKFFGERTEYLFGWVNPPF